MSEIPDTIDLRRDRDLQPRQNDIWIRRALFALVCAVPILALTNLFGQQADTSVGTAAAAGLAVTTPSRVRGGLLYQARFDVTAKTTLNQAALVLDQGWLEDLTINTIEPSPVSQTSADGKLAFGLGRIPAGQTYALFMNFQVNPVTVGTQDQTVTLYDGSKKLITLHRTLLIFP